MKRMTTISGVYAFLGLLILILDSKTSITGAQEGIELCLKTVIPSLFPFIVLSIWLTGSFFYGDALLYRPFRTLCNLPAGTEGVLISGFLGGYPVGAQNIATAYRNGQIFKNDAEKMLSFCNNAGPSFIFGMLSSYFPEKWMLCALWLIHIFSAILVSQIIRCDDFRFIPKVDSSYRTLTEALQCSIHVMGSICGWIIFFRIVISFVQRWILWLLPKILQVSIIGLLELSNGCCELHRITSIPVRFLVCSGMLALGGCCITMQTISVARGLSLRYYFQGKLLQFLFSILISGAVVYRSHIFGIGLFAMSIILFTKGRKSGSNLISIGV